MNWIEKLEIYRPCSNAVEYCRNYPTAQKAWDACERGDWMLWLLGKLSGKPESPSRRKLVLTACKCARLSLKFVSKDEKRPLKAIQTAEAWAKRKKGVTLDDVKYAAADADAAAYAAYAAADADAAADAAAYAAYAAYAAAVAAYAAADAVAAVAAAVAAYAARTKILKKCADIVRKNYPKAPRLR